MAGVHRRLGPRGVRAESDPVLFEELRVAEQVAALRQFAADAATGQRLELARGGRDDAANFGEGEDGARERVLTAALQCGGDGERRVGRRGRGVLHGVDTHQFGLAFGERAGLVEDDGVEAVRRLERGRVLDQDAAPCGDAGAGRRRRR